MSNPRIEPLGDTALLIRFGTCIDAALNARALAAADSLQRAQLPGVTDIVPAYASVCVRYEPGAWTQGQRTPYAAIAERIDAIVATVEGTDAGAMAVEEPIVVPVCYGGAFGPDLEAVAAQARLSVDETVARHCAGDYRVAMLGFAPGFAYLLGLDATLHTPRRADPRVRVPAGSVAIGGAQTGIYPRESPGGWNLIGRTPLNLFDVEREPPALLGAGRMVRFRAIDAAEFADWNA